MGLSDMQKDIQRVFQESVSVKQETLAQNSRAIEEAAGLIIGALRQGNRLFIFGNGGSAADSQHMAAELIGRFQKERKSLPALALTTDTSALTALGNDYGFEKVFARQLEGLARPGDVALAISTSGTAANVLEAVAMARTMGMKIIGLTGRDGGRLAPLADVAVKVPSAVTARIQESHSCIAHCLCELIENALT